MRWRLAEGPKILLATAAGPLAQDDEDDRAVRVRQFIHERSFAGSYFRGDKLVNIFLDSWHQSPEAPLAQRQQTEAGKHSKRIRNRFHYQWDDCMRSKTEKPKLTDRTNDSPSSKEKAIEDLCAGPSIDTPLNQDTSMSNNDCSLTSLGKRWEKSTVHSNQSSRMGRNGKHAMT